jgi:hypothetical protein
MTDKKDYRIQSVLFDKTKVTLDDCFDWLVEYGFKIKKSYETDVHYNFQQYDTTYLKRNGFAKFVTKPLNDKVSVVMVYPNPLHYEVKKVEANCFAQEEVSAKQGEGSQGTKGLPPALALGSLQFWVPTVVECMSALLAVVGFFVLSSSYYISK